MARNAIAKKTIDLKAQTVTFDFSDGNKLICAVKDINKGKELVAEPNVVHAVLHGIAQVNGDSYAGCKTAKEAREAAMERWNTIKSGEWSTRTGDGKPKSNDLAEAIAKVKGQKIEEVRAKLEKSDKATIKALREHPAVAAAINEIRLARQTAKLAAAKAKVASAPVLNF
jgi:hypothetical protein